MTHDKRYRPMLADNKLQSIDQLEPHLPLFLSVKLDGIRAVVVGGVVLSRTLKPIPSAFVQRTFGTLEHADGELICGDPFGEGVYNRTHSACMTHGNVVPVGFFIFDHILHPDMPYTYRLAQLHAEYQGRPHTCILEQTCVYTMDAVLEFEEKAIAAGYEGIVARKPSSPYKYGRSTLLQGWMIKVKRVQDSECEITGFEELYRNQNEAKEDALGYTKRSSHKANMVPAGTLGAVKVRDIHNGKVFNIGSGFDMATRDEIWHNQEKYLHTIWKYKYIPYGELDLPRQPRIVGPRDPIDI